MNLVDTGEVILRAILDEPASDLHRLAYADWLTDQDCNDPYAQFIRVQVELAKLGHNPFECQKEPCSQCPEDIERWQHLHSQEKSYMHVYENIWRERCFPLSSRTWNDPDDQEWTIKVVWARGFISAITSSMRGFIDGAKCLFSHHPIEKVTLSDRESCGSWLRCLQAYGYDCTITHHVHSSIFKHFPKDRVSACGTTAKFDDPEQAKTALSDACVAFGRGESRKC